MGSLIVVFAVIFLGRSAAVDVHVTDNTVQDRFSSSHREEVDRHLQPHDAFCAEYCSEHGRPEIELSAGLGFLIEHCYDNETDECPSELVGIPLNCWNVSTLTSMDFAFHFSDFNEPLGCWDVSIVTSMWAMFSDATSFNQPLDDWNVSSVTRTDYMFYDARSFNQDVNTWDVSSVTVMDYMFANASSFNQPLDEWNVSSVTGMWGMFEYASSFNQPLDKWNVSSVARMYAMFRYALSFNQPLDEWDVSSVPGMEFMFRDALSFNQPLDGWDVSSVTRMDYMFYDARSFNQSIRKWKVSNVRSMYSMFTSASSFNQPLAEWDVSSVTGMNYMFYNALSFNQPLDEWDVSSARRMNNMFYNASSFDQCLATWRSKTRRNISVKSMFRGSGCPNTNDPDVRTGSWCQSSDESCFVDLCKNRSGGVHRGLKCSDVERFQYKKKNKFCKKSFVKSACPGVCNIRCTCKDKPRFVIKANKHNTFLGQFKCRMVGKQDQPTCKTKINNRKVLVREVCPRKCNFCFEKAFSFVI